MQANFFCPEIGCKLFPTLFTEIGFTSIDELSAIFKSAANMQFAEAVPDRIEFYAKNKE